MTWSYRILEWLSWGTFILLAFTLMFRISLDLNKNPHWNEILATIARWVRRKLEGPADDRAEKNVPKSRVEDETSIATTEMDEGPTSDEIETAKADTRRFLDKVLLMFITGMLLYYLGFYGVAH